MAVIGTLVTDVSADTTKFSRGMTQATQRAQSFAADVSKIVSGIVIADIGKKIAGGMFDAAKGIVNLAAEAETMRIEMEVLTGSAKEGGDMFKRLEKFAARTSFNLNSAAESATQLIAKGIPTNEVMDTMEMLGNLARGNSEKLGLIAKAYTDVRSKGRLMAQETNQFAENGINIFEALAKTTGKNTTELIAMREAGQITFEMLQEALAAMTGEGGRFAGMMDRINKTFTGQFQSLIENIQSIGRELGEAVLPALTDIVSKTNEFVGAFKAMGDQKWSWLSDVFIASFDVAMETIKLRWVDTLNSMIDKVASINWAQFLNPLAGVKIEDLRGKKDPRDLNEAKSRLGALMQEANARRQAQANAEKLEAGKQKAKPQEPAKQQVGLGSLFAGMADNAGGLLAGVQQAVTNKVEKAKFQGNWLAKTAQLMFDKFTNAKPKEDAAEDAGEDWSAGVSAKLEPKFASAMQAGSSEAFSTILANMTGRGNKQITLLSSIAGSLKQNVGKPLQQIEKNTKPQFAPEFVG